ncbi:unnamed protein product [Acanthoscelides obtectus]|uniref:Uncharacterized protein n=1 Tax=Acanthoscelides obtectus TaxID=200917 RepID=A0A9P0PKW2_ACAOB|nr:unnamed protein product [Acanthoscelides obtectus]CAK1638952.1 hypothetical protein AOBTE_LOCUS10903 [Acanthoscelides obtectus]
MPYRNNKGRKRKILRYLLTRNKEATVKIYVEAQLSSPLNQMYPYMLKNFSCIRWLGFNGCIKQQSLEELNTPRDVWKRKLMVQPIISVEKLIGCSKGCTI